MNADSATGFNEIGFDNLGDATAAGRLRRNLAGTSLTYHDGTAARQVATSGGVAITTAPSPPLANALYQQGLVKGWAKVESDGTVLASYNVTSVVLTPTGRYTITWDRDFASADYVVTTTTWGASVAYVLLQALGSVDVQGWTATGTNVAVNVRFNIVAFGAQ